ncbi:MAG: RNA polymerase sigma factor [Verrucomicrobia bacterium]|nr:RNA polymerase sigma factor [Verrucomicrobiota bacterium]MBM3865589.1 RNA polymerase sigma factor [Verrucomicrobiota bacterium]
MPPPDSELQRWFAEEVQPHEAALRVWLTGRFAALRDVDDIVQEAYVRLLRARGSGPIACPRAFLFVTARNLALNHLRHQRHERPAGAAEGEVGEVLDGSAAIPDAVAVAEELRVLVAAIESLPARCRQIVSLRKIYGLSQREVATRLGISEHTVESQGSIGLQKCVAYFRRYGYGRGR